MASFGLLILPLLEIFAVTDDRRETEIHIAQAVLAIAVLVFSLLVGAEDFSGRATRMHLCAIDLASLANVIDVKKESADAAWLEQTNDRYTQILTNSENHTLADHYIAKYQRERDNHPWKSLPVLLKGLIRNSLGFAHYVVFVLFLTTAVLFFLLTPQTEGVQDLAAPPGADRPVAQQDPTS